jgi:hypothetical protein
MAKNQQTPTTVATESGAFKGLKTPRELLQYNLMRGVTDFSNLEQWDLYEKGYPFLCVVSIPQFLRDLAEQDDNVRVIVNNYVHILENDFRGIDNIDNITGETGEITNGIRSINVINKVMKPTNSNFNLNYYERSGSILTKAHELYLTGIKDPDTKVKHYHGLIDAWTFNGVRTISGMDPGPHQECFSFMYFVTDNTMTKIERAFLIAACQPTTANYSDLYTGNKGEIQFAEVSLSFNGFFINNDYVYQKAQDMLLAMRNPKNLTATRIVVDSNNFRYKAIAEAGITPEEGKASFDTPGYWSESEGRVNDNKAKDSLDSKGALLINSTMAAYAKYGSDSAHIPGTEEGKAESDPRVAVYADTVAAMAGKEHAITIVDGGKTESATGKGTAGNSNQDAASSDINKYDPWSRVAPGTVGKIVQRSDKINN